MYYVIHSTDPYLLARMATDLMCNGCKVNLLWCDMFHPFDQISDYLFIYSSEMEFHPHNGVGTPIRLTLTEKNYLQILITIIKAKTA